MISCAANQSEKLHYSMLENFLKENRIDKLILQVLSILTPGKLTYLSGVSPPEIIHRGVAIEITFEYAELPGLLNALTR